MDVVSNLLFAAFGICAGIFARFLFIRMPDSWLLDYDQAEAPSGFEQTRAFPFVAQGIFFICLVAVLFARIPDAAVGGWQIASAMAAVPILLLILVADWKTQIIPDQLTLFLIVPGLFRILGSIGDGERILTAIGFSLITAVIAGGSLFLIGLIAQALMKREAMGMGDVKMIAAAAFLVGLGDLLLLVLLSFFSAALIAVPLLVRRMIRQHRSNKVPDESEHMTDDAEHVADTAIAFGPYIAIAVILLILFHRQIDQLVNAYLSLIII